MSELARRLNQCRKPTGHSGKTVVEDMNKSHYELTSWGIKGLNIEKEYTILDAGCGGGVTVGRLAQLASQGEVFGIDYSEDCVKWASQHNETLIQFGRVHILRGSVDKLPFNDNKFNIVTAVETIYFWPDLVSCFCEIGRVLKSNGKFVVINEIYKSEKFKERNEKLISSSNMAIHSPQELKELLQQAGFKNISIETVEDKNWLKAVAEK
ncbi:class I SAM-dependent methyltransferase [Clostridium oryzae]|uniref:Demethylmenaquinone methyltransferase n=1 Tax=Clostridium oryzae TaxID=1450648 RepID=A0A1V4IUG6_9CLOT|nr:class I SAM-dependent methyltransferase [Clostridium oryzae]OPJ63543.1 demethylmenaquinone methyltransferase [Clostridium oryzae]